MTSKLKCPFCGKELGGNMAEPCCRNQNCEMNAIPIPRTIWEKLIQAKQDLGIARNALKEIKNVCDGCRWCDSNLYDPTPSDGRRIAETTNKALEQIEHIADVSKMIEHKE